MGNFPGILEENLVRTIEHRQTNIRSFFCNLYSTPLMTSIPKHLTASELEWIFTGEQPTRHVCPERPVCMGNDGLASKLSDRMQ